MLYGVCCGLDIAQLARKVGYDYIEISVTNLLKPLESKQEFYKTLEMVKKLSLSCPVSNGFIPRKLKITGPEANIEKLEEYVTTTCKRANIAGVEIIVFGSGGARKIPEEFDKEKARQQIIDFLKMLGPIAQKNNVTIAIEPLRKQECNILNTIEESAIMMKEVNHPSIRLLADGFHWAKESESADNIISNASDIIHTHIATTTNRLAPGTEECTFVPLFFKALKDCGYDSRISFEGKKPDPEKDLPTALSTMKKLWNAKEDI